MYISKISGMFQQNNCNSLNRQAGRQTPLNVALNKVANKATDTQQKSSDDEFQAKMKDMKLDSYTQMNTSENLEDEDPEVLKFYAEGLRFEARMHSMHEDDLTAFKKQLTNFDEAIQGCQDVINGDKSLPDGATMKDMEKLLTATQQVREKYLKGGCAKLNGWSGYNSDPYDHILRRAHVENKFSGTDNINWQIDASASDIYAEIDRVSEATRGVTQTLNEGLNKICNILEKKGYGDVKYRYHETTDQRSSRLFPDSEMTDTVESVLALLKKEGSIQK